MMVHFKFDVSTRPTGSISCRVSTVQCMVDLKHIPNSCIQFRQQLKDIHLNLHVNLYERRLSSCLKYFCMQTHWNRGKLMNLVTRVVFFRTVSSSTCVLQIYYIDLDTPVFFFHGAGSTSAIVADSI
jgi:hypothetical protein